MGDERSLNPKRLDQLSLRDMRWCRTLVADKNFEIDFRLNQQQDDLGVYFKRQGATFARGHLVDMAGSQVLVSYGLIVDETHRRQGYSEIYNDVIRRIGSCLERAHIIAYVRKDNVAQRGRLQKLGWRRLTGDVETMNVGDIWLTDCWV